MGPLMKESLQHKRVYGRTAEMERIAMWAERSLTLGVIKPISWEERGYVRDQVTEESLDQPK